MMRKIIKNNIIKPKTYIPKTTPGIKTTFYDMKKCLDSFGYVCLTKEKDYKGFGPGVLALCPKKHECTVRLYGLRKKHSCCKICSKDIKIKKTKQTNIKRYGGSSPMCDPKVREKTKQTNIKRYGVENASQNPEIVKKILKSRCKDYLLPSGKVIKIQGYEGHCIKDLLNEGYTEDQILNKVPIIDYIYNDVKRKYFPDIYIADEERIIEVKSIYTFEIQKDKNLAKAQSSIDHGYKFEFRIYSKKGELIETI